MKNKKLYTILTATQIVLLFLMYFFDKITRTRMGMMRHMAYMNAKMPEFLATYMSLIILILTLLILVCSYFLSGKKFDIANIFISAYSIFFAMSKSVYSNKAYYGVLLILLINNIVGAIKLITKKD